MSAKRLPDFEYRGLQIWIRQPGDYKLSIPRGFNLDVERVLRSPGFLVEVRKRFPEFDPEELTPPVDARTERVHRLMERQIRSRSDE